MVNDAVICKFIHLKCFSGVWILWRFREKRDKIAQRRKKSADLQRRAKETKGEGCDEATEIKRSEEENRGRQRKRGSSYQHREAEMDESYWPMSLLQPLISSPS